MRLPNPPRQYDDRWANQYTRQLEQEIQDLRALIEELRMRIEELENG